jgi:signal transduction histidine kinase
MHEDIKRLRDILNTIQDEALRTKALDLLHSIETRSQDARQLAHHIANMSHELRTPLNTIIGYSDILEAEMDGTLSPEQHDDVAYINQAGKTLLHVLGDLSNLARITVGQLSFSTSQFEIAILLEKQTQTLEAIAETNDCRLTITLDVLPSQSMLETDRDKLIHILKSLVQHAAQGSKQRLITIAVSDAIWLNQGIRFLVQEQGRGSQGMHWNQAEEVYEIVGVNGLGLEQRLAQFMQGRLVTEVVSNNTCTHYILELPYRLA